MSGQSLGALHRSPRDRPYESDSYSSHNLEYQGVLCTENKTDYKYYLWGDFRMLYTFCFTTLFVQTQQCFSGFYYLSLFYLFCVEFCCKCVLQALNLFQAFWTFSNLEHEIEHAKPHFQPVVQKMIHKHFKTQKK